MMKKLCILLLLVGAVLAGDKNEEAPGFNDDPWRGSLVVASVAGSTTLAVLLIIVPTLIYHKYYEEHSDI